MKRRKVVSYPTKVLRSVRINYPYTTYVMWSIPVEKVKLIIAVEVDVVADLRAITCSYFERLRFRVNGGSYTINKECSRRRYGM